MRGVDVLRAVTASACDSHPPPSKPASASFSVADAFARSAARHAAPPDTRDITVATFTPQSGCHMPSFALHMMMLMWYRYRREFMCYL